MECVLGKIKGLKENVVCRSMHTMQTMFLKVYNSNEFIEKSCFDNYEKVMTRIRLLNKIMRFYTLNSRQIQLK